MVSFPICQGDGDIDGSVLHVEVDFPKVSQFFITTLVKNLYLGEVIHREAVIVTYNVCLY